MSGYAELVAAQLCGVAGRQEISLLGFVLCCASQALLFCDRQIETGFAWLSLESERV